MKKIASATDPLWYKDAIIYELHIRAFADSNNDGIGDFQGLISKLDYLQDLGVTCIWILPFFPSPLRDDGYDIANYTDVNPSYGTLSDFKQFLDAAHQRNMQVMIELVINHTSDQHPWFKAARLAPPGSPEREMYVWSQTDQVYKNARIIFTDTEKSNWTWDEVAQAYYWHRFFSHQPDLNWDNPRVMEEVLKAMRFWLDMGVDALRMDAIPYLVERDGTSCENLPETHHVIKAIRAAIDVDYANRLILAEANQWPADVRPYFGDGDECHMAFHFPLMPRIYMALRQEDRLPITDIMAQTPPIPDSCQWGLFLRNHDELTLEMVTDDERDYMYFAYSADPRMRINVGIRRRLAPLVDNNRRRIELLNSLLLSFPGTPILYYGDEIGMGDNIYLGDRNGVRTPMQWTSDRNAGFSKCDPARLYFPVVMDPIYGYQVVNVEAQQADQSSLLQWTRNMIALRKLFQVFGRGTLSFLNPSNRKILAYLREFEQDYGTHEIVLCVANLSRFAQPVSLDLAAFEGMEPVEMLGYVPFPTITAAPYQLTLAPYSFLWLELQPASSGTRTLPEPQLVPVADPNGAEVTVVDLVAAGWSGLLSGNGLAQIEAALPAWLPRQRWFGAKSRRIQSARILQWADLSIAEPGIQSPKSGRSIDTDILALAVFFVEITYFDGEPDIYQLPLAISAGQQADAVTAERSDSILTTLTSTSGIAVLHDATVRQDFRRIELALIERSASVPLTSVSVPASLNGLETEPTSAAPNSVISSAGEAALPAQPLPLHVQPGEAAAGGPEDRTLASSAHTPDQAIDSFAMPASGTPGSILSAHASTAFRGTKLEQPLSSRVGSAEQSNTSILYANALILKLFRRLQTGENPDVEIGKFLTEVAHFKRIPPFLGEISVTSHTGEKTTVAMLQGLVANEGDGWAWFLRHLSEFYTSVGSNADVPDLPVPRFEGATTDPARMPQSAQRSVEASSLLGRRTAEMHLALSCSATDPAFEPEPCSSDDLQSDAHQIETSIRSALESLKSKFSTLDESAADGAALLLTKRSELLEQSRNLSTLSAAGQRIRIHGDYHLGQTLRTHAEGESLESDGDFVLLDFEGEPARPLSQRRRKQSPLKDVAGMLRSFSYVAFAGLKEFQATNPGTSQTDAVNLSNWARAWQDSASAAFLQAYRETIAKRPELLPNPSETQSLLDAYVLEKAFYELMYELNNRPAWIHIPITGILSLCK
ncbi:maltose alpha-D-glucosyltransferase [Telmatobacter sp. DSM 110680]|uniref:Maltokinase n=1 Tax=Telmatobacter sp. DSM 110680 TaxID=3036704 RepID=A0AAU7DNK8_9BACT